MSPGANCESCKLDRAHVHEASDALVRGAFFCASRFPEIAMRSLRSLAPLLPIIAAVGCASLPARQPAPASEITFDLPVSPAGAREQLAAAFAANGLPVATSQPGVVEYHAPRERGPLGYYEVFARAVIVPLDCGTRITIFGEETRYRNASSSEGTSTRIGPSSTGRGRDVWTRLEAVASAVRGNGTMTRASTER
jgi:hypothetical protein